MHISSLHLYTYTANKLIDGQLEISYDAGSVKIQLSEIDRKAIQDICVTAFLAEREKHADAIRSQTPAFVALEAPREEVEEAEYEPF